MNQARCLAPGKATNLEKIVQIVKQEHIHGKQNNGTYELSSKSSYAPKNLKLLVKAQIIEDYKTKFGFTQMHKQTAYKQNPESFETLNREACDSSYRLLNI